MHDLRRFFATAPRRRFVGPVYRITAGSHRNQVLSMRGAIARGGRFNLRGYFGTLYASLEPVVAFREMKRYFTVPPDAGFVLASLTLRLSQVVDLSNPLLRRTARINLQDLTGEDYAPTTEIRIPGVGGGRGGPNRSVRGRRFRAEPRAVPRQPASTLVSRA